MNVGTQARHKNGSARLQDADRPVGFIQSLGRSTIDGVSLAGDFALFFLQTLQWLLLSRGRSSQLFPIFYQIGVQSFPVILVTGGFIGMVLAIQTYEQFAMMDMENHLGTAVNVTLLKELGPVLAAVMLAGRVGSSMAAELGTMRVTEQIDALTALGANPIAYLVVPRFIACLFMIPLLTIFADGIGVLTSWGFSTQILGVNSFYYWYHSRDFVTSFDLWGGIFKSFFFGAVIAIVSCNRGFHCEAGAQGVGKAATEAFVYAFMLILAIDFLLGFLMMEIANTFWPKT